MTTHRSDRLADVIHRALAEIVQRQIRDPRVGFVTLTGVTLSHDLRHARVYISAVVGDADLQSSLEALNHATPFLRRELARRTQLRFTPRLRFFEDSGVRRGVRVEELLEQVGDDVHTPDDEPGDGR